ncbi:hypothetical protein LX36DRAFT_675537 [Colletotrichum falcatum]|nr:hypothetical protein LX36DRAFT_675537 [Colletotrichum falcatum]
MNNSQSQSECSSDPWKPSRPTWRPKNNLRKISISTITSEILHQCLGHTLGDKDLARASLLQRQWLEPSHDHYWGGLGVDAVEASVEMPKTLMAECHGGDAFSFILTVIGIDLINARFLINLATRGESHSVDNTRVEEFLLMRLWSSWGPADSRC